MARARGAHSRLGRHVFEIERGDTAEIVGRKAVAITTDFSIAVRNGFAIGLAIVVGLGELAQHDSAHWFAGRG